MKTLLFFLLIGASLIGNAQTLTPYKIKDGYHYSRVPFDDTVCDHSDMRYYLTNPGFGECAKCGKRFGGIYDIVAKPPCSHAFVVKIAEVKDTITHYIRDFFRSNPLPYYREPEFKEYETGQTYICIKCHKEVTQIFHYIRFPK